MLRALRNKLLLPALLLALLPAAAQAEESEAERLNREGKVLYGSEKHEEALDSFRGAFELDPQPKYLFNAARTLEVLGRSGEAFAAYEEYLERARSDEDRRAASEALVGICTAVARGRVRVPAGIATGELLVDGEVWPVGGPVVLCLAPGSHRLELRGLGETARLAEVEVEAGEEHEPRFVVSETSTPGPAGEGARPRATAAPQDSTVLRGGTVNPGWFTLGGAAAAAVTGGVLYYLAFDRFQEADAMPINAVDYDRRFDGLIDEGDQLRVAAIGSLAGAAVLGVVTWVIWDGGASDAGAPLQVLPLWSSDTVGLQLGWSR